MVPRMFSEHRSLLENSVVTSVLLNYSGEIHLHFYYNFFSNILHLNSRIISRVFRICMCARNHQQTSGWQRENDDSVNMRCWEIPPLIRKRYILYWLLLSKHSFIISGLQGMYWLCFLFRGCSLNILYNHMQDKKNFFMWTIFFSFYPVLTHSQSDWCTKARYVRDEEISWIKF